MKLADFYLAASAVLPILLFADTLSGRQVNIPLGSEFAGRRLSRDANRIEAIGGLMWWPFYAWSEFISLRLLQVGHSVFGGTTVVWIALAIAFVQLAVSDIVGRWFTVTSEPDMSAPATSDPGGVDVP